MSPCDFRKRTHAPGGGSARARKLEIARAIDDGIPSVTSDRLRSIVPGARYSCRSVASGGWCSGSENDRGRVWRVHDQSRAAGRGGTVFGIRGPALSQSVQYISCDFRSVPEQRGTRDIAARIVITVVRTVPGGRRRALCGPLDLPSFDPMDSFESPKTEWRFHTSWKFDTTCKEIRRSMSSQTFARACTPKILLKNRPCPRLSDHKEQDWVP